MSINSYSGIQAGAFVPHLETFTAPTASTERLATASQSLSDSMEEVSMVFSASVERNSKALNERNVTGKKPLRNIERVEKLAELYRLLDQPSLLSLGKQAQQMQSLLRQKPSLEDLLDLTEKDPTRASIVLQQVQRQAQAHGNHADSQVAEQYLGTLHEEYGEQIRAGLNTASAIAEFSADPSQKQAMRHLYYQAVVNQQSVGGILDALLERFEEKDFSRGLRSLQRALADDIGALAPSLTPSALRGLLGKLNASSQLSHTLQSSHELLERMTTDTTKPGLSAVQLTRNLLRLSANGVFVRDFQNLTQEAVGKDPLRQAPFLNALHPLVQHLPMPLWKDPKTRQSALGLMRTLLDEQARSERLLQAQSAATKVQA
nr:type III secretion system gatekeeper subunit SctW [uncultured Pseudomonas sp.]